MCLGFEVRVKIRLGKKYGGFQRDLQGTYCNFSAGLLHCLALRVDGLGLGIRHLLSQKDVLLWGGSLGPEFSTIFVWV